MYLHSLGLVVLPRNPELVELLTTDRIFRVVLRDLGEELLACGAIVPCLGELVGGVRNQTLVTGLDDALGRVGQRREEVGSGLTVGALKSHVGEKRLRLSDMSEEYLTTFVQNNGPVEELR